MTPKVRESLGSPASFVLPQFLKSFPVPFIVRVEQQACTMKLMKISK
jgi:hypothetical protein